MLFLLYLLLGFAILIAVFVSLTYFATLHQRNLQDQGRDQNVRMDTRLDEQSRNFTSLRQEISSFTEKQANLIESLKLSFEQRQQEALQMLQKSIQSGQESNARQLIDSLSKSATDLGKRVEDLTFKTDQRLQQISGQVEKRLSEGFEKTTATFTDVLKRLALIDEAQKKITELSSNVVSLQHVLSDKKSRGAFGEVQLNALVRNVLAESTFAFQHTLQNGHRADCILFLPAPTGNMVIDSKFSLENYKIMTDPTLPEERRSAASRQFKIDIKKHIADIASRYIVPEETSDGAIMFIPAEAVFAEIHAHHSDLVEASHRARVWIASPTTMMAVLTTVQAVLKDVEMRKQMDAIRTHLRFLSEDFGRFQKRMENLATHVRQAHDDMEDVHRSATKLTGRFQKIAQGQLQEVEIDLPPKATNELFES